MAKVSHNTQNIPGTPPGRTSTVSGAAAPPATPPHQVNQSPRGLAANSSRAPAGESNTPKSSPPVLIPGNMSSGFTKSNTAPPSPYPQTPIPNSINSLLSPEKPKKQSNKRKSSLVSALPPEAAPEERLAKWRSKCTVEVKKRLERAKENRLVLLARKDGEHPLQKLFDVLGSQSLGKDKIEEN